MTIAQGEASAVTQAAMWGARAHDWARIQEPLSRPLYDVVFERTGVGPGVALLDLGCGSGVASARAARLGASVAGLDATAELIAIARTRTPTADFKLGELEAPPYADGSFDVVVGFNSFQYVADPVNALSQARRVARPAACVAIAIWGKPEECEAAVYLAALGRLLPPSPPGTPGPFALSSDDALEALASEAGLTPGEAGAVRCPWVYPDLDTALRGLLSAGPAPYRWTELAIELAYLKHVLSGPHASRAAALMDAAMYDALVAAWGAKYAHNRPRPSAVDATITPAVAVSPSPAYPCEHATVAGAASVVLGHLFPQEASSLEALAEEAGRSRMIAGVQYPSDVAAGLELGRAVGAVAVERARTDNFGAKGTWAIPTEPGKWTGPAVVFADDSLWKPWLLSSGSQLRPPPPPAFDSPELAAELAEVRDFPRTPRTNGLALGWQYGTFGGPNAEVHFTRQASRRMFEERWDFNAPRAAQVYLLTMVAFVDTWIASQDAKFHYWSIRPNQLDPALTTVFPTPPFPSYPSNRAGLYTAMASILAHSFPRDAQEFRDTAQQISESAIWAGIHFRSDLTAAQAIASEVARLALARTA